MTEYTEDQYKEAARKAYADGNTAAAKRLIAMARKAAEPATKDSGKDIDVTFRGMAPLRPAIDTSTLSETGADMSLSGRIKDNVIGVDDGVNSIGEKIGTLLNMGTESLTLGLAGDEFRAKGDAMLGVGDFESNLRRNRANENQMRTDHPLISLGADVAPALVSPVAAAKTAATLGGRVARASATAGAGGAMFGFLEGENGVEERAQNAAITGGLSMALGGAGPIVGRHVKRVIDRKKFNKAIKQAAKIAPDNEALEKQATDIFKAADKVPISRQDFATQMPTLQAKASSQGFHNTPAGRKLAPKSAAVLEMAQEVADGDGPMKIGDVRDLRKVTRAATGDFNNSFDQTIGASVRGGLDEAVSALSKSTAKELGEANKMWGILKQSEQMDEIFAKASQQASGFENGLRIQFRQILNSKKKRAQFSPAVQAAMAEVVRGSKMGNLMKKIGKLGFGRGAQTNMLSGTAGAAVFGPAASVAGQAALAASESLTARRAKAVQDLIRIGGAPQLQIGQDLGMGLMEALNTRAAPRLVEGLR